MYRNNSCNNDNFNLSNSMLIELIKNHALKGEPGRDGSYVQKAYKTFAAMLIDKENIPVNSNVVVNNDPDSNKNAFYTYDGVEFTKSDFDPQGILTNVDNKLNQAIVASSDYFQSQVADTVNTSIINANNAYDIAISANKAEWDKVFANSLVTKTSNYNNLIQTITSNSVDVFTGIRNQAISAVNAAIDGVTIDANLVTDALINTQGGVSQRTLNMGMETITDLIAVATPYDGMRVYVKGKRGGEFKYDSTQALVNNGGTIFNGWVRQYTGSVFLEWFCDGFTGTTDCAPALQKALAVDISVQIGSGSFLFKGQVGFGGLGIPNHDGTVQYNWGDSVLKITGTGHTTILVDTKDTGKPIFTSTKQLTDPTSEEDIFAGKIEVSGINFIGVNKDLTVPEHWEMVEGARNLDDRVFDLDRLYNTYVHHCNFTWLGKVFEAVKNNAAFNESYSQSFTIKDCHFFHCNRIVYSNGTLINFTFKDNMCEKNYGGIYAKGTGTARINDNLFEGGGQFIHFTGDTVATTIDGNYLEYNVQDDVLINKCQIFIGGNTNGALISGNSFTGLQSRALQDDADYCDIKLPKPTISAATEGLLNFESNKAVITGNHTDSRQLHTSGAAISTGNRSPNWITYGYEDKTTTSNYNSASARANHEAGYSFSSGSFVSDLDYEDYTQITRPTGGYKLSPAINIGSHPSGVGAGNVMIGVISVEHMLGDKGFNKVSTVSGRLSANIDIRSDVLAISHISIQFDIAIFNAGKYASSIDVYNDDAIIIRAGKPSILEGNGMLIVNNLGDTALTAKQFPTPETSTVTLLKTGRGRYAIYISGFNGIGASNVGSAKRIESSLMWQGNVNQFGVSEQYAANVALIGYWW